MGCSLMPSNVYKRGDAWCARRTVDGGYVWLGTHPALSASSRVG